MINTLHSRNVERITVSNINYLGINEQFPVPGQDNDTQVFRDNFDTIKQSLRTAKDEITALEGNTAGLRLTDIDDGRGGSLGSDFNLKLIENAQLRKVREYKNPQSGSNVVPLQGAETNVVEVDFQSGSYHVFTLTTDVELSFENLPGDPDVVEGGVGRMTLELYSDSSTTRTITFRGANGTAFMKSGFPLGSFTVSSNSDPVIIEVWRHSINKIFLRYVGLFTE